MLIVHAPKGLLFIMYAATFIVITCAITPSGER